MEATIKYFIPFFMLVILNFLLTHRQIYDVLEGHRLLAEIRVFSNGHRSCMGSF
jgi:hypothetical protein